MLTRTEPLQVPAPDGTARRGYSWQVIAALVLVLLSIGVAVTLGLVAKANPVVSTGPLPVATVGQPGADSAACKSLMLKLPADLAGARGRAIEGGGDGIAAWGDPAVILRCGLETPQELTCSAALTQVNGVSWLQLDGLGSPDTTYIAADRSVRIAVTIPEEGSSGAIGRLSDVIAAALPVRPPCRNGILLPADTK